MKKYNQVNLRWLLMGIVLPILLFFSVGGVLAYFTATVSARQVSTTTAQVVLTFNSNRSSSVLTNTSGNLQSTAYTTRAVTHSQKIVPGNTVTVNGSLTNDGNVPIYSILQFEVYTTLSGESEELKYVAFYVLNTNDDTSSSFIATNSASVTAINYNTYTLLVEQPEDWSTNYANYFTYDSVNDEYVANASSTYSAGTYYKREFNGASVMTPDAATESKKFQVSYTFAGTEYGNEYKNASARTVVTGLGIQVLNIDSAQEATRLLIKRAYDAYSVANKAILLTSTGATASYLA